MGLFDNLFGGGDNSGGLFGSAGLYGDLLTQAQQQAIAQRGFAGFLGGLQKSGALDYTVPFISGKVPASFAAGMAGGAAGAADARDQAGLLALKGTELGLNAQQLRAKLQMMQEDANDKMPPLNQPGGGPPTTGPSTGGPSVTGPSDSSILPLLGQAVEQVESGGNPRAVSPAGAIGLRQIMPSTAADYGVTDKNALFDATTNRQLGDTILGDLHRKYGGNLDATLVAYNAGPKWADKFVLAGNDPSILPAETQAYLPKVKATLATLQGGHGLPAVPNFAGMMTGNQGPSYAPPVAQGGASASPLGLTEGDSIGVGFQKFGGLAGNPVGGRNPQAVLDNISANLKTNPNYYSGKTVLLSSGTMNDPDGSMTGLIPQQIAAIQQAGGKVVLAGADTGKFAPRNAALASIAQQSNVPFAGPLPTDNVHPGPDGYRDYLTSASALLPRPAPASGGMFGAGGPQTPVAAAIGQALALRGPAQPMASGAPSGINPAAIAWAQRRADRRTLLGIPVSPYVGELSKLPLVGPTAAATADAQEAAKARFAQQIAALTAQGQYPFQSALERQKAQQALTNALAEKGMAIGPNGQIVPIGGYNAVIEGSARAKATGEQGPKINEIRPATMAATGDQIAANGGMMVNTGEAGERGRKLGDLGLQFATEARAAKNQNYLLDQMLASSKGFNPGAGADETAFLKSLVNGVFPNAFSESLPSYQEFSKYAIQNAREQTRTMGAGEAASVFQTNIQANPNAKLTREGLESIVGGMHALNDYVVARDQAAAQWRMTHGGSMDGFDNSPWVSANPILKFKLPYMSTAELQRLRQSMAH